MNITGEGWFAMIARIVGMSRMQYLSMRIVTEIESAHQQQSSLLGDMMGEKGKVLLMGSLTTYT